ncbi:MAG TPA: acetyl-CoA C-acyltransferase FadI, partial [Longimicrobiales bacterium]|nr:acetyl-CoA C-acyltransferase FadI [Longimicrobiales bacterium]
MSTRSNGRRVAIVDGVRTPFAKSGSAFKDLTAIDLGIIAVRELVQRSNLDLAELSEVVYGTVVHAVTAPNIAREVALGAGLPPNVPAHTVSRACASANQAITSAADTIGRGYSDVAIAGGAEVLSDIPMLLSRKLRSALLVASRAKTVGGKAKALARVRPRDLAPTTPAIAEPTTGETMGQSAERMAKENGISRADQDRWALRSHQLAAKGTEDGRLMREIVPVYVPPEYSDVLDRDNGIRPDTSAERLAQLPPVFDRKYGSVTAGNSSPLTDGASAVLLMSEELARALGYEPLGYIRSYAYSALSPGGQLLQGPAYAAPIALDRAGITMRDIELMEMHEAFAAQVLSNLQALDSDTFARNELGRSHKVGIPDENSINVMGGSIAIGHPFGATGARLTVTLLNELKRRGANLGLITVCAAGALGFAMVVSRE